MTATANDQIEAEANLRRYDDATEAEIAAAMADLGEVTFTPGTAGMTARSLLLRRRAAASREAETRRVLSFAIDHDITAADAARVLAEAGTRAAAADRAERIERARAAVIPAPSVQRGRSSWTNDEFSKRWQAACGQIEPPYTYPRVAARFVLLDGTTGDQVDPDYLGRLWRERGCPQPAPPLRRPDRVR